MNFVKIRLHGHKTFEYSPKKFSTEMNGEAENIHSLENILRLKYTQTENILSSPILRLRILKIL
jgi:hypothetical protein